MTDIEMENGVGMSLEIDEDLHSRQVCGALVLSR